IEPHPQQRLLDDLLGIRLVPQHPAGQPERSVQISAGEQSKSPLVPPRDSGHEIFITWPVHDAPVQSNLFPAGDIHARGAARLTGTCVTIREGASCRVDPARAWPYPRSESDPNREFPMRVSAIALFVAGPMLVLAGGSSAWAQNAPGMPPAGGLERRDATQTP